MDPNITFREINQLAQPLKGVVINNKDPLNLRRVQVKVEGVFEGKDTEGFPWACPAAGQGTGRRANVGGFEVPKLYSTVLVSFPNGDMYSPQYSDYTDEVCDAQIHKLYGKNYPNQRGKVEECGTWKRSDDTDGWEEERHFSGRYIKTDKDGNVQIHIPKNVTIKIDGNCLFKIKGKLGFCVDGDIGIVTKSNFGLKVGGNIGIEAGDFITLEGSHIHLNDGKKTPTADNVNELTDTAVEELQKLVTKLKELMELVKEKGKAGVQSLKSYADALVGTKKSGGEEDDEDDWVMM